MVAATGILVGCSYYVFALVAWYAGILCDPRQHYFADAGAFAWHAQETQMVSGLTGIVMAVAAMFEAALQLDSGPSAVDFRFYPRLSYGFEWMRHRGIRLLFVVWLLLMAGWAINTEVILYRNYLMAGGNVWFPNRGGVILLGTWALFWFADALCRPRASTVICAIALGCVVLLAMGSGFSVLRE
jgi:hypothetical protein